MPYIKTEWIDDVTPIDAERMNHIEDGIENATEQVESIGDWARTESKPAYTAQEVGADPAGSASQAVNTHNVSADAHQERFASKQDVLTFDTTPTEDSANPVTSGGVYTALSNKQNTIGNGDITNAMLDGGITGDKLAQATKDLFDLAGTASSAVSTHNSSNSAHEDIRQSVALKANAADVYSKGEVDSALSGKQNALSFDSTPTDGSNNPVTSNGIYDALTLKANSSDVYGKSDVYTKGETDTLLGNKANSADVYTKSETYTKTEVNTELGKKQNTLTFDSVPTDGSTNPVESNGIYDALTLKANANNVYAKSETYTQSEVNTLLGNKQNTLTFDTSPTESSTNPVTSGGVYTALSNKQNTLTFDNNPTENSDNPVKSGGIYTALGNKQNTLTFDSSPTNGSSNPVTSGGVYTALGNKQDTLTFDNSPTENSNNPVKSGGIYTALAGKADSTDIPSVPVKGITANGTSLTPDANGIVDIPAATASNYGLVKATETESYTIATSDWAALSSSNPYTYSATVTATHTIGNDTIIELVNNQPILFANHGFAIAGVSGQVLTVYSIGVPDASVALEVDYNG